MINSQLKGRSFTRGQGLKIKPKVRLTYMQQATTRVLGSIKIYEQYEEALSFGARGAYSEYGHRDEEIDKALWVIKSRITDKLSRCYKDLFMLGTVTDDPHVRTAAREIAYSKFLKDAYDLSHYLGREFNYKVSDKNAFKKEMHQLARSQGHRRLMMDQSSLLDDVDSMKEIIRDQKERIAQLEETLRTIDVLKP